MAKGRNATLPIDLEDFIKKVQKEGDIENLSYKLVNEYFKKLNHVEMTDKKSSLGTTLYY